MSRRFDCRHGIGVRLHTGLGIGLVLIGMSAGAAAGELTTTDEINWNKKTLVDAYARVGHRDRAWDAKACQLLEELAYRFSGYDDVLPASLFLDGTTALVDKGCQDPLIFYVRGNALAGMGKNEEAQDWMRKALAGFERFRYPACRQAWAAKRLAEQCHALGGEKRKEAQGWIERAIAYAGQAAADGDYDAPAYALFIRHLNNLRDTAAFLGVPDAKEKIARALAAQDRATAELTKLWGDIPATPHYDAARVLDMQAKREEAYREYRASIEAGETIEGRSLAQLPRVRAFRIATDHLGRTLEGVELMEEEIRTHAPPSRVLHAWVAKTYYTQLRDYVKARDHWARAAELALADGMYFDAVRHAGNRAGGYKQEAEDVRRDKLKANVKIADEILQQASEWVEKVEPVRLRKRARMLVVETLGVVWCTCTKYFEGYSREKNLEWASEAYELAKEWAPDVLPERTSSLGATYVECGEPAKAIPYLVEAAKTYEGAEYRGSIFNQLSQAYEQTGDWPRAQEAAMQSLRVLSEWRKTVLSDATKTAMPGIQWQKRCHQAIDTSIHTGRHGDAFETMESAKARATLDLLAGREPKGRTDSLTQAEKERELVLAQLDDVRAQVEREKAAGNAERVPSMERSLTLMEKKAEKLREDIENCRKELRSLTSVDPIKIDEAKALVPQATVLEYWCRSCRCCWYVTVLRPDFVHTYWLGRTKRQEVQQFRDAIQAGSRDRRTLSLEDVSKADSKGDGAGGAEVSRDPRVLGEALYKKLIKPIEQEIKTDLVYVMPDGPLNDLPFHALHDGRGYLVEKHAFAYAPSVSVLKYCIARRKPFSPKILAFGNPNLQVPEYRLVHAEDEVNRLAELFPGTRVLLREAATEKAVRVLAPDFDVLHFACHATLHRDEPMRSCLRLAPDTENDGYLHAAEIFDMNLNASLVTLSACDSGLGKQTRGGEVLGLARALMVAGTPSVVGSLWKVDDKATSQLMVEFYTRLKAGKNKAVALREAQRALIEQGASPFHWAAFALYGDYE